MAVGQTAEHVLHPLLIVSVVYIVLDSLFVFLRFVSRQLIRKSQLGWDDWLLIPAFVFNLGSCVLGIGE